MASPCQPEPSRDSEPASSDTRSARLRSSGPGGRGRGPGGFGTFRGSSRCGGTQAAGSSPRPAAARSVPEGVQAASTEVSAVAGRAGAVCGPGNPLPARGRRGRLVGVPALAATDSGGPTARSPGAAAGHGGGRRWAPGRWGRGRGQGGRRAAVGAGRARHSAPPVHTPLSPHCLRARSPALPAAEFCWGPSMLGRMSVSVLPIASLPSCNSCVELVKDAIVLTCSREGPFQVLRFSDDSSE